MKKQGAVSIVVMIVVVGFGTPAPAADDSGVDGGSTEAIWLVDDFEDGNLDGWNSGGGSCVATATSATAGLGTYSMEISGSCSGHLWGRWYDVVDFQALGVDVMLRPGSTSVHDAYFVAGDDNIHSDLGVIFFYAKTGGRWTIVGEGGTSYDCGPYTAGQWYDVSFALDWKWRTITVRIDGELRHVNVPFRSLTATTLSQIHAYNYHSSIANWDQVYMADAGVTTLLFTDGFDSGDASGWTLSSPAIPSRMYIYDAGGVTGAIGGRRGADILCYEALGSAGLPWGVTTRALLSVDAEDEIRDMPANYGVPTDRKIYGSTQFPVADNWADLLDGSIDFTLSFAGVLATNFWYSGSYSDGSVTPNTCSGWTDGSTTADGRYGLSYQADSWWINRANAGCGGSTYHVLCVAWR